MAELDQAYPQDHGYPDDVFDVLDAHQHPCIVMGRSALLWMVQQCCRAL